MTQPAPRAVYLQASSLLNAAGNSVDALFGPAPTPSPLAFANEIAAFHVETPALERRLYDRKIQRSVEDQGLRLLDCVARLAPAVQALPSAPERLALCAALPEVDAPSPCWDAIAALGENPDALLASLFNNTPPLHALTLLNSSVMSYVAEALACHGPMAGYCAQESAAFDALYEAWQLLREDRADSALVISSSPNLTPAVYLREEAQPPLTPLGEGAAALLLSQQPSADAWQISVQHCVRAYCPVGANALAIAQERLTACLSQAHLQLSDLALVVADPSDPLLQALLPGCRLHSSRSHTGDLGASSPLTDIAYACAHPSHTAAQQARYVLLCSHSRQGHLGLLLLHLSPQEAHA